MTVRKKYKCLVCGGRGPHQGPGHEYQPAKVFGPDKVDAMFRKVYLDTDRFDREDWITVALAALNQANLTPKALLKYLSLEID